MQLPGVLPLAFFLFLVPVLIPVLERFWPTSTVWWSAIVVAVLGALSSAIYLVYQKQLSKAGMQSPPTPAATPMAPPDGDDYTYGQVKAPKPRSAMRRFWLG